MENNQLVFVTGGVRSGKSSFAENRAIRIAVEKSLPLYYIATAKRSDTEMDDRIERHRLDREQSKYDWNTIESPTITDEIVNSLPSHSVVLLDCLTILLANELQKRDFFEKDSVRIKIAKEVVTFIVGKIDALVACADSLIIVSNEVFYEPFKKDESIVSVYRESLGLLHQQMVAKAEEAYSVEMGLPMVMKGGKQWSES